MPDVRSILIYGLGIALAAALVWGGVERMRGNSARTDFADYKATAVESARLADRAQRTEEQRRQDAANEEASHAQTQANALAPDVRRAALAADSLRSAAASRARGACPNPPAAAASPGQPDSDSLDLLADVLGRSGGRNAELAEYADRLRIAGGSCEAIADRLQITDGR